MAGSLNKLANVYLGQGKYGEAERLYRRAPTIYEDTLGRDRPDKARVALQGVFATK